MAEMQAVEKRSVVLLGKTGAGKSTVANKISGRSKFKVKNVAASVTAKVEDIDSTFEDSGIRYDLQVIDTIGVFDLRRKNDDTMNEIKKFFQDNAREGVNLVLFVLKKK